MVQRQTGQETAEVHLETAREAIELLDRQFPWLRDAETLRAVARGLARTAQPGASGQALPAGATHVQESQIPTALLESSELGGV